MYGLPCDRRVKDADASQRLTPLYQVWDKEKAQENGNTSMRMSRKAANNATTRMNYA